MKHVPLYAAILSQTLFASPLFAASQITKYDCVDNQTKAQFIYYRELSKMEIHSGGTEGSFTYEELDSREKQDPKLKSLNIEIYDRQDKEVMAVIYEFYPESPEIRKNGCDIVMGVKGYKSPFLCTKQVVSL